MIIKRNKKNKKIKNRKKQSWLFVFKKILFWVLFISFCGTTVWTLFFSEVMKVRNIVLAGATAHLPGLNVEKRVAETISGKFLNIVPKNNLLLVSKKKIENDLRESNKLIRDVTVEKRFPKSIVVGVEKRESHIIWCNREDCMLVDERGEAFCDAEEHAKKENVRVVDESGKQFSLGSRVAEPDFVFFSEQLPHSFSDELHTEIKPVLQTPSSMSEEIRVTTDEGWMAYFSTARPLEIQLKVLKKIIREKISPSQMSDLEYVDLRIKGKVTYKFRQKEDDEDEEEGQEEKDN